MNAIRKIISLRPEKPSGRSVLPDKDDQPFEVSPKHLASRRKTEQRPFLAASATGVQLGATAKTPRVAPVSNGQAKIRTSLVFPGTGSRSRPGKPVGLGLSNSRYPQKTPVKRISAIDPNSVAKAVAAVNLQSSPTHKKTHLPKSLGMKALWRSPNPKPPESSRGSLRQSREASASRSKQTFPSNSICLYDKKLLNFDPKKSADYGPEATQTHKKTGLRSSLADSLTFKKSLGRASKVAGQTQQTSPTPKLTKESRQPFLLPRRLGEEKSISPRRRAVSGGVNTGVVEEPNSRKRFSDNVVSGRLPWVAHPGWDWTRDSQPYPGVKYAPSIPEMLQGSHFLKLRKYLDSNPMARNVTSLLHQAFGKPGASRAALPTVFKTSIDFYRIKERLGKGCFGEVYLAEQILTGCDVALKLVSKHGSNSQESKARIDKEVTYLRRIGSADNVIRLLEAFEDPNYVYLVFEYAPNGDLVRYFQRNPLLSETQLRPFFAKILRGVESLHAAKIIHRDIKLDNILLDRNLDPKICDLGISTAIEADKKIYDTGGTPAYLAPEVIQNQGDISEKSDVWSLGILLYLLTFGFVPFREGDVDQLFRKILVGKYSIPKCNNASAELLDLISRMLTVNPTERIGVRDIFGHPWLAGVRPLHPSKPVTTGAHLDTLTFVFTFFLIEAGFPESYVTRCIENRQANHVRACFDLLFDKFGN